jgi:RNA polymerase sigma factor (sigma-70 family)
MGALTCGNEDSKTSPTLLRRLRDWEDAEAWMDFVGRYRGMIRGWCRDAGLGAEAADEVLQRVLVRLAIKIQAFCYDPSGSFRGWFRVMVRREVVNYRRESARSPAGLGAVDREFEVDDVGEETEPHALLDKGRRVHDAVKARETEKSWRCFWESDISGIPLAEVAVSLGTSYHAAFMARKRVRARLIEEAGRAS